MSSDYGPDSSPPSECIVLAGYFAVAYGERLVAHAGERAG